MSMPRRYPGRPSCSCTPCKVLRFGSSTVGCRYALRERLRDFIPCLLAVSRLSVVSTVVSLLPLLRQELLLKVLPAQQGLWDQMACVAEENPVAFFDLVNDAARETRRTSRVVQELQQDTNNTQPATR